MYITLDCSYGCVTDELAERIATELIAELKQNTVKIHFILLVFLHLCPGRIIKICQTLYLE